MGLLFENMTIRDLRVYASALHGDVHHFLDKNGLEIDAIIRLRDGKYRLVETKLGAHMADDAAKTLIRFAGKIDTRHAPAPSFLMVLIGVGTYAYRRDDGVLVVPLSTLRSMRGRGQGPPHSFTPWSSKNLRIFSLSACVLALESIIWQSVSPRLFLMSVLAPASRRAPSEL